MIDAVQTLTGNVNSNGALTGSIHEVGAEGLSAYGVYLKNGGTLSETEWLDSLKGESGKDGVNGIDGKDGYTPVKGTDYWTEEDQISIKDDLQIYFDEQLGVIENGTY